MQRSEPVDRRGPLLQEGREFDFIVLCRVVAGRDPTRRDRSGRGCRATRARAVPAGGSPRALRHRDGRTISSRIPFPGCRRHEKAGVGFHPEGAKHLSIAFQLGSDGRGIEHRRKSARQLRERRHGILARVVDSQDVHHFQDGEHVADPALDIADVEGRAAVGRRWCGCQPRHRSRSSSRASCCADRAGSCRAAVRAAPNSCSSWRGLVVAFQHAVRRHDDDVMDLLGVDGHRILLSSASAANARQRPVLHAASVPGSSSSVAISSTTPSRSSIGRGSPRSTPAAGLA